MKFRYADIILSRPTRIKGVDRTGDIGWAEYSISDISSALGKGAYVQTKLPNGSIVQLTKENFEKSDNELLFDIELKNRSKIVENAVNNEIIFPNSIELYTSEINSTENIIKEDQTPIKQVTKPKRKNKRNNINKEKSE